MTARTMGRTIIVGDVHGCPDELDDLLDRVAFVHGRDRLVLVGDLVARGPDSARVIERAIACDARAVRGNHDEKVLSWWRLARDEGEAVAWRHARLSERHEAVVRALGARHFEHLAALPLLLPLPEHGALVVHAGVDPARPPEATPPDLLLNMRSVDDDGAPTRRLAGTPWAKLWRGPTQVVFGHDARRGLQVERFATGLDTGCCYGRELTALVLDAAEPLPADERARRSMLVSVHSRQAWCPMGDGNGPE